MAATPANRLASPGCTQELRISTATGVAVFATSAGAGEASPGEAELYAVKAVAGHRFHGRQTAQRSPHFKLFTHNNLALPIRPPLVAAQPSPYRRRNPARARQRHVPVNNMFEQQLGRSISIDQAAKLLQVSRRTIYNWIRDGRLLTIRTLGGSQRVLLTSLEESRRSLWNGVAAPSTSGRTNADS